MHSSYDVWILYGITTAGFTNLSFILLLLLLLLLAAVVSAAVVAAGVAGFCCMATLKATRKKKCQGSL